ncbi:MAG: hypothetical protein HY879_21125 [Deltaproteobacteria bacterium]|nr:hypothetical protein [Deltaproteobacteria bacterium]
MAEQTASQTKVIRVTVDSGICGFHCVVEAWEKEKRQVIITVSGSECKQIQSLSEKVKEMNLRELFAPIGQNLVFTSAQSVGCHPSCPVPIAILKAVEVAMGMALPRDAVIRFES